MEYSDVNWGIPADSRAPVANLTLVTPEVAKSAKLCLETLPPKYLDFAERTLLWQIAGDERIAPFMRGRAIPEQMPLFESLVTRAQLYALQNSKS